MAPTRTVCIPRLELGHGCLNLYVRLARPRPPIAAARTLLGQPAPRCVPSSAALLDAPAALGACEPSASALRPKGSPPTRAPRPAGSRCARSRSDGSRRLQGLNYSQPRRDLGTHRRPDRVSDWQIVNVTIRLQGFDGGRAQKEELQTTNVMLSLLLLRCCFSLGSRAANYYFL